MAVHDVEPTLLITKTAQELKSSGQIKPLEWAIFVKTGMNRERPPVQNDWWFIRSAAVLRKLFIRGPIGTSKLRVAFGGKKNRGMRPERFYPASGNHLRKILQQLEKAGLAKQTEKGVHKGRVLTPQGHKLLEKVASDIMKEQGIVLPKKPDVKLEVDKPPRTPYDKGLQKVNQTQEVHHSSSQYKFLSGRPSWHCPSGVQKWSAA